MVKKNNNINFFFNIQSINYFFIMSMFEELYNALAWLAWWRNYPVATLTGYEEIVLFEVVVLISL